MKFCLYKKNTLRTRPGELFRYISDLPTGRSKYKWSSVSLGVIVGSGGGGGGGGKFPIEKMQIDFRGMIVTETMTPTGAAM